VTLLRPAGLCRERPPTEAHGVRCGGTCPYTALAMTAAAARVALFDHDQFAHLEPRPIVRGE